MEAPNAACSRSGLRPISSAGARGPAPSRTPRSSLSERPTTQDEFLAKISDAIALSKDRPIITHCGSGGRGGKAAQHLCDAGYDAYNGGGPAHIASARVYEMTESGELPPYTPPMP